MVSGGYVNQDNNRINSGKNTDLDIWNRRSPTTQVHTSLYPFDTDYWYIKYLVEDTENQYTVWVQETVLEKVHSVLPR